MIRINGNIVDGDMAGRSVIISNNRVIIDGKDFTPDGKEITIVVEGDIDKLEVDYCKSIKITGNVISARSTSGNMNIAGEVKDSVSTVSGDVEVDGSIGGSVTTTSGDVKAGGTIGGSVSTLSGDIRSRK